MCDLFKSLIITQDFDGIYFVDPYSSKRSKNIGGFMSGFIADNQKRIEKNVGKYKILQKLHWLQNYFYEKEKIANISTTN